jgi:hypothetical protein
MKELLFSAALIALAAPAHATVDLCFGPPEACTTSGEQKIFLQAQTNTLLGLGNVGSQNGLPVVDFASHDGIDLIDLKNGFATIKPSDGKNLTGIDITIPGHTFGDFLYDVQMFNNKSFDDLGFTVQGFLGGVLQDFHTYTGLGHDTDLSFDVVVLGGLQIDELKLFSDSGFKELKHFQVSGLDPTGGVPEPSTWAMGVIGFAMLGAVGWRKKRTARYAIA